MQRQQVVLDLPPPHPRAGPRGVPDRVHDLRRHGLSGGDRLGGDVRSRPRRADGGRDRADMAAVGVASGSLAGAGRRARLPLGPRRGDHGRDPYLVSVLGAAYVQGLQSAGVIATLKHFAGYSAARAGRNRGPVSMGRRELMDVILPFRDGRGPGGAGSVMNSYSDVDGVPAVRILAAHRPAGGVGVRRQRRLRLLGGAVPGDHAPRRRGLQRRRRPGARRRHRRRAAGHHRLRPRPGRTGTEGRGCRRPSWTGPPAGSSRRRRGSGCSTPAGRPRARWPVQRFLDLDSPANRALAREMAERSVILLEAGLALPFSAPVAWRHAGWPSSGPAPRTRVSSWAATPFPTTCCRATPVSDWGSRCRLQSTPCRRNCLVEIVHAQELPGAGEDRSGFEAALAATRGTDLAVAIVGDLAGLFGHGTSGGCDAEDLRLPGVQADLLDELLQAGTPVVVVVVSGRPYASATCMAAPPAWSRRSCRGRREGRSSPASCPAGSSRAGNCPCRFPSVPAGGQDLPPAALGSSRRVRDQRRTTPLYPFGYGSSYELRGGYSTDQRRRGAHRRRVHRLRPGPQHGPEGEDEVSQLCLRDLVAEVAPPR